MIPRRRRCRGRRVPPTRTSAALRVVVPHAGLVVATMVIGVSFSWIDVLVFVGTAFAVQGARRRLCAVGAGSMGRVWPYLAGQRLLIEPMHLELGDVGKGKSLERELRVLNLGSKPVKLVGSQSSCGCMSLDDFPIEVPGGGELSLRLGIGTPSKPSVFEHTVKLFSSERGYSVVVVTVSGESH